MREYSPDDRSLPEKVTEPGASPERPEPSVLESVLRQTLSGEQEWLSQAELDALRSLVARHRGEPFALQPHGVELVATLLRDRLLAVGTSSAVVAEVAREVATSLSEVTELWLRVEKLWRDLAETSA